MTSGSAYGVGIYVDAEPEMALVYARGSSKALLFCLLVLLVGCQCVVTEGREGRKKIRCCHATLWIADELISMGGGANSREEEEVV